VRRYKNVGRKAKWGKLGREGYIHPQSRSQENERRKGKIWGQQEKEKKNKRICETQMAGGSCAVAGGRSSQTVLNSRERYTNLAACQWFKEPGKSGVTIRDALLQQSMVGVGSELMYESSVDTKLSSSRELLKA
jgi:hypothetical protein